MMNSGAQRAELHKTIWSIANVLRGSVDGWDFKQYVLGFLFYRFISEDITSYLNEYEHQAGDVDFDYAKLDDATAEQVRKSMVEEKGYFILPSDLFANVRKRADGDENLNETLQRVFKNIEGSAIGSRSESSLRGLFDDLDLNSRKLGDTVVDRNAKLVKVLNAIGDLDLGTENFADNKIDAFGDAYEYLMTMYAANAGKSGGEFFTPQEVSELLTRIATHGKSEVNKVYDPACGSGSLLLQSIKVLGKDKVRQGFFGQEKNLTTYNLCRINMFLHDVNFSNFDIALGDTLTEPAHWDDQPFDAIVSNPPYSTKWVGKDDIALINDPRFAPAGVLAPKSKADLAFTMHMLHWLAEDGTAAIVEFPGVLYRGAAEGKIRKYLVENNFVHAVIQLPPDLRFQLRQVHIGQPLGKESVGAARIHLPLAAVAGAENADAQVFPFQQPFQHAVNPQSAAGGAAADGFLHFSGHHIAQPKQLHCTPSLSSMARIFPACVTLFFSFKINSRAFMPFSNRASAGWAKICPSFSAMASAVSSSNRYT